MNELEEYEVEAIQSHKEAKSSVLGPRTYLIKWKGWPPNRNTWEKADALGNCPLILSNYLKKNRLAPELQTAHPFSFRKAVARPSLSTKLSVHRTSAVAFKRNALTMQPSSSTQSPASKFKLNRKRNRETWKSRVSKSRSSGNTGTSHRERPQRRRQRGEFSWLNQNLAVPDFIDIIPTFATL